MTQTCATVIGIVLQLFGAAYLIWQAWRTTQKLGRFGAQATYDNFSPMIETLAHEIGEQFTHQLIGFAFLLVGSAFQLYAAVAA